MIALLGEHVKLTALMLITAQVYSGNKGSVCDLHVNGNFKLKEWRTLTSHYRQAVVTSMSTLRTEKLD